MNTVFRSSRLLLGALLVHSCLVDPTGKLSQFGAEKIAQQLTQKPAYAKYDEKKLYQEDSLVSVNYLLK